MSTESSQGSQSKTSSTKLPAKKGKHKKLRSETRSALGNSQTSFGEPELGGGGVLRHSPSKVGSDGYPKYERSMISVKALRTLDKNWTPPPAVESKLAGTRGLLAHKSRKKIQKKGALKHLLNT